MHPLKKIRFLIFLLLFLSLSCSFEQLWENPTAYLPTATPGVVSPLATATPLPQGHNRENPLWPHESVTGDGWELKMLSYMRGNEATEFVVAGFSTNKPPPEGMEYIAIKLMVEKLPASHTPHMQLRLTGSSRVVYDWFDSDPIRPDPSLETDLESISETTGWMIYTVPQGITDLMLYIDDFENDDSSPQFLALEPGTQILPWNPPADLASISAYGSTAETAVPFRHQLITPEWKIEIRDLIRGEQAWERIFNKNRFNDPPSDQLEYMLVYIVAQSLHLDDKLHYISDYDFAIQNQLGATYENPSVVNPDPEFDATFYSGGIVSGWAVFLVPKVESNLLLQFDPPFQYDEEWFFSLTLTGR